MCTHTQAASTLSLMGYPGMMGTMFFWMALGMLLFAVVAVGVVWLVIRATRIATRSSLPPTPYYAPYERGQQENTISPDAPPRGQEQQDGPPASSLYEQPHAQYPEMQ